MTTIETLPKEDYSLRDVPLILKKLGSEEAKLLESKQNLKVLKENLQKKAKAEIERRTNKILELKNEIADLKAFCDNLVNILNMGVETQNNKE